MELARRSLFYDMEILRQVKLKDYSNFQIGGPADYFVLTKNIEDLIEALEFAKKVGLEVFILGGGTNILWPDNGFRGLILKPELKLMKFNGQIVRAGASVSMQELVDATVSRGLAGLEWAGGLPGSFGGAIFGNAGAFGGEIKDLIIEVISLDCDTGEIIKRRREDCGFDYRTSIFKLNAGKEIILEVALKLTPGDKRFLNEVQGARISYRKERHPLEYPNIGSIFKNVAVSNVDPENPILKIAPIKVDPFPVIPTAYLVSEAKLKGMTSGGATISPKHPNFIVNVLNARASDVLVLITLVKNKVKDKFDINLEEEVRIIT